MKQTVDFYEFIHSFESIRPDNFSREGLSILWDYLESYEDESGIELELDVIAICCDFSEDHAENIARAYDIDLSGCIDEDEIFEEVKNYLENEGAMVGEVPGGFVYRDF